VINRVDHGRLGAYTVQSVSVRAAFKYTRYGIVHPADPDSVSNVRRMQQAGCDVATGTLSTPLLTEPHYQ